MKQLYFLLIMCVSLSWMPAQAQNWRPFRPNGDVHAFRGASADTVLTLHLDSAAVNSTDSVYYFNRILRRASSFSWQKSRNNQFGTQMRYNVAQRTYVLYWNGGDINGFSLDRALVLKPFVPVGTTWSSYFTDYGVTTKLLSRGTSLIDGVQDSVATFQVGASLTVVLSKHYGLVSAPKDLAFGVPTPKMLTLARRPEAAGRSYFNPVTIMDLQPGDELGYLQESYSAGPFPCYSAWHLRRVLSRQLTTDSLIYTFQQQSRSAFSSAPGCSGGTPFFSGVAVVRLAASLRTGAWKSTTASYMVPQNAELLTYAYRGTGTQVIIDMAEPFVPGRPGNGCVPAPLYHQRLYRSIINSTTAEYRPGLDALNWNQGIAYGVGATSQGEFRLTYFRRTVNGTAQTCGSRTDFATLLPTQAAQRAALLQLYPNPARAEATLTLPAAPGATTVRLLDALGRPVSRQLLPAGQTTTTLPLQQLAAGVYLVEVQTTGEAPRYLRLEHQP